MIGRRNLLALPLAASVLGSAVSAKASGSQRRPTTASPDVAVVGAGAFGGFTALCLLEKGMNVVSIDSYGPSSPRAGSGGETRSIRSGYGDRAFYSAWSLRAMELWRRREEEFGRKILFANDRVEMAREWSPGLTAQRAIFDRLNIGYEVMDRAQLRVEYPQMNFDDVEFAFVEKTSAAVIMARESLIRTSQVFQSKGGQYRLGRVMPGAATGRRLETVKLQNGETLTAGTFVFACGAWSPSVFPDIMPRKVAIRRSEYFYWGVPAGDDRFSWPKQPAWADHIDQGYGFGSIERGLKYSPDGGGTVVQDPDNEERLPNAAQMAKGRRHIRKRFPGMADAPIVETRACQMEVTADDNFLIDRHPDYDNVWIASGGGGHGFKFAPLLGEYISDRVLGRSTDPEIDQLFQLAGRADQA